MSFQRDVKGIRTTPFYLDAASNIVFKRLELTPCSTDSREYCLKVEIFIDLIGECTVRVNDDVHAVFMSPRGEAENRFIPINQGYNRIVISPSSTGILGERLFNLRGVYLYVKEPWTFRLVVEASLLTDLAELTGDKNILNAINQALDAIEIEEVADWQLKASMLYSIVKPKAVYLGMMSFYGIEIDSHIEPMDFNRFSEMSRKALETLRGEVSRIYEEIEGSKGLIYAMGHAHIDVAWL